MAGWSQEEFNRTIDEVKRRSLIDPDFRVLALSDSLAALAKINPKPLPAHVSLKFIDGSVEASVSPGSSPDLRIVLPAKVERADELSDTELEEAAGGMSDIKFPFE